MIFRIVYTGTIISRKKPPVLEFPGHLSYFIPSAYLKLNANCPFLFYRLDVEGEYHSLGDFRKAWHHCLKLAELNDVRFHDTHHCSATDLYANGNPERVIMNIAGWKTPMLTTYRHKNSLKSAQMIKFSHSESNDCSAPPSKLINR